MPHDTSARPARTTGTPTSVYRYLDADGVLIYVGITNRGMLRQNEHNIHAKWWRYVVSQEVEHYDDRETAARRERYLIERHRPPFNTQHNPDHLRIRSEYLAKVQAAGVPCGHCSGCQMRASDDPEIASSTDATCRLLIELDEDEEPSVCSICRRPECAYQDGIDEGHMRGWREGYDQGEWQGWERAHEHYRATTVAHLSLRAVVDGQFANDTGCVSIAPPGVEQSRRDLEANIAVHGIAALVEKASTDPWMVP